MIELQTIVPKYHFQWLIKLTFIKRVPKSVSEIAKIGMFWYKILSIDFRFLR